MQKKRFSDYSVKVKIRNGFIWIDSDEFSFKISAGEFSPPISQVQTHIGRAVLDAFHWIQNKLDNFYEVEEKTSEVPILISIGEASQKAQVSISTMRRLIEDQKIQSIRTTGGHRKIVLSSLLQFLNTGVH